MKRPENLDGSIQTIRLCQNSKSSSRITYQPGDHIVVFAGDGPKKESRHYTISSSPLDSDSWLEISVKKETLGRVSKQLHETFQLGASIRIKGPFPDEIQLQEHSLSPLILLSGGVGITPMMAISKYLQQTGVRGPYTLYTHLATRIPFPLSRSFKNLRQGTSIYNSMSH